MAGRLKYKKNQLDDILSCCHQYERDEAIQVISNLVHDVKLLMDENSLLCPAGDFDVITTLKAEKILYMEEIERLEKENEHNKKSIEMWHENCRMLFQQKLRYRKALQQYAMCPECIGTGIIHFGNDPKYDYECGRCKIARQALAGEEMDE